MRAKVIAAATLLVFTLSVVACQTPVKGETAQRPAENRVSSTTSRDIQAHYESWVFEIIDLSGGDFISYGVLAREPDRSRPLLVFLDGSGYQSAFGVKDGDGWVRPGGPYGFGKSLFTEYDLLVPEKINVTTGGNHEGDVAVLRRYSLDDRVESAATVIDKFLDETTYETVFIFGVSEGGAILPKVYNSLENKSRITKLVISGAGGLGQYDEFKILQQRDDLPDTLKQGYEQIDSVVGEIRANPNSIEKRFFGHSYRRWSGFLDYGPLDDLVLIDIPILLIHGAKDVNSPVETARIVVSEFDNLGKTNLSYQEYEEMGHGPSSRNEQEMVYKSLREWLGED